MSRKHDEDSAARTPGKKPYRKPALKVHGDVRSLTRVKGAGHQDGGGGKPATKAQSSPN